jgi:hypothetical protein
MTQCDCILHNVAQDVRSAGIAVKNIHRSHPEPRAAIVEVAAMPHCDLIVADCHTLAGITGSLPGAKA